MAGYGRILLLSGGLLCSLLGTWWRTGQVSQAASQNDRTTPEFLLPQKHRSSLTPAEQKGLALFSYYCTICHGATGRGDGFNSFNLATPPADLADPSRMAVFSDSQIQKVIKEGGASLGMSSLMPPWGGVLTDEEIAALTDYIRTLAKQEDGKK